MRQLFVIAVYVISIFFASTVATTAKSLEECLQDRIDSILAGEEINKHTNIEGLLYLALGRGNYAKINKSSDILKTFKQTTIQVLKTRIREKAGEFVGAKLKLKDTTDKYSAEGIVVSGGQEYNISISFSNKSRCVVNDISIHGAFNLRDWVRERPEIQSLMKKYKLAR